MICGVLIVLAANGLQQKFLIYLRPVSIDLEIGRKMFGFVIAFQTLLSGLRQPMADMAAYC